MVDTLTVDLCFLVVPTKYLQSIVANILIETPSACHAAVAFTAPFTISTKNARTQISQNVYKTSTYPTK